MLTLIYTVALGLGIGVTAMVARRIGEKDAEIEALKAQNSAFEKRLANIEAALQR